jgi:hypothetical protein
MAQEKVRPIGLAGGGRSPGRLALAVLLIAGGGLLFVQLYRGRARHDTIVVMQRDVVAGAEVTDADVRTVEIVGTNPLGLLTTEEFASLNGRTAQVHLRTGLPLQRMLLGAQASVSPNEAVVAVSLPTVMIPTGLRPDARVRVLADALEFDGRVVELRRPDQSTTNAGVSLRVNLADAAKIAGAKEVRLFVVNADAPAANAVAATGAGSEL